MKTKHDLSKPTLSYSDLSWTTSSAYDDVPEHKVAIMLSTNGHGLYITKDYAGENFQGHDVSLLIGNARRYTVDESTYIELMQGEHTVYECSANEIEELMKVVIALDRIASLPFDRVWYDVAGHLADLYHWITYERMGF